MRRFLGGIAASALVTVAGCGGQPPAAGGQPSAAGQGAAVPRAVLDSGDVSGVDDGDVLRFRGIPYASPPLGTRRWQPPQPVRRWSGVKPATKSGPYCAQPNEADPRKLTGSEDCLTVDVTVPKRNDGRAKPVMVWLHGGGFTSGAGQEYDPRRLAVQGDVIVVTVEYRLGVFGYLSLPGMAGAGTYGLLDQQAALRWVQRNARAFGGDRGNVTLFGESGGGVAVCGQLTSPGSRGLFAKAIMQSGSCGTALLANTAGPGAPKVAFWRTREESYAASRAGARQVGCRTESKLLECLRGRPATELVNLTGRASGATYGTPALPLAPARALERGAVQRVPVLSGHARDEGLAFASLFNFLGKPVTDHNLRDLLVQAFGGKTDAVIKAYPRRDYPSAAQAWAAPYTDDSFACPQVRADDALARHTKVYAYEFADRSTPPLFPSMPGFPAGASHGAELTYLFEVKDKPISYDGKPIALTSTQQAVAADMVAAWTAFAHTGRPSANGNPWPRWTASERKAHLITSTPASTATSDPAREHKCLTWESIAGR